MASITAYHGKKGTTYKATIRKKGFLTQTKSFKRKTDAKSWINDTESNMNNGRRIPTKEMRKKTLADLIDRTINEELPKEPKSENRKKSQLLWWKDKLGHVTLANLTSDLLAECRDELTTEPYYTVRKEKQVDGTKKEIKTAWKRQPPTANRYIAALSKACTIARTEWKWLDSNPFEDVRRNPESKGRRRFLKTDELDSLLKACAQSRNEDLYDFVLLDISSGGRASELKSLTWESVLFEGKPRIIFGDTKNGEWRSVPLIGAALTVMTFRYEHRRPDTNLVFPSRKNPLQPMDFRTAWENAVERAGLLDFRFHDNRHTTASYLAMNGASLLEIANILGHKTMAMVKRYAHLTEMHTLTIMEKMNLHFLGHL